MNVGYPQLFMELCLMKQERKAGEFWAQVKEKEVLRVQLKHLKSREEIQHSQQPLKTLLHSQMSTCSSSRNLIRSHVYKEAHLVSLMQPQWLLRVLTFQLLIPFRHLQSRSPDFPLLSKENMETNYNNKNKIKNHQK